MHHRFITIPKSGFSLLEVTVVMFVMGLTITALLQLFQWGFVRYGLFADDWKKRAFFSEMRIWLRHEVADANSNQIRLASLPKHILGHSSIRVADLGVRNQASGTVFITINAFDDKNKNGKPEKNERYPTRLFCFNKRSSK